MSTSPLEVDQIRINRVQIEDLPDGLRPLAANQLPLITADGSAALVELEQSSPRGPWLVVDLTSGVARVGRRLPRVWGGLVDGGLALLGTSGGLIEVDLMGAQLLRELADGVGRGRGSAVDSFLRLDGELVLVGRRDRPTSTLVDLEDWSVRASRIPVAPPWVVLGGPQTRVWSLPRNEVVTLDASGQVLDRQPAPPALAATVVEGGVAALVGTLKQGHGPGGRHLRVRGLLPSRFQHWMQGPLEDVALALLDPQSLDVVTRRPLRGMTRAVEGTLAPLGEGYEEQWAPGLVGSTLTTDVLGRLIVLGDRDLFVLDPATLRKLVHKRLPGDHWSTHDGVSCAVAIGGERTLLVADW